jgi:hypothetical protein
MQGILAIITTLVIGLDAAPMQGVRLPRFQGCLHEAFHAMKTPTTVSSLRQRMCSITC